MLKKTDWSILDGDNAYRYMMMIVMMIVIYNAVRLMKMIIDADTN